jgi:hypothetical protein
VSVTSVDAVARVVAALEHAAGSVTPDRVPDLARADVAASVMAQLAAAGRTLVEHTVEGRPVAYASGYDDTVADRLADEGLGVLDPFDAAVVTLVLLHTVALPAARGREPVPWSSATGVSYDRLADARRCPTGAVKQAVSRLDAARVLTNARSYGIRPGPALDRLTPAQRRRVEARLAALAMPDDPVIARLAADSRRTDDVRAEEHDDG